MSDSSIPSIRRLRLKRDTVTVFKKHEAPAVLQEIDLSNEGTHIFVVPDACAALLRVYSLYHAKIAGATVYVV